MTAPKVVVLGGGVAGMAAAYALARGGLGEVTLVERAAELGGLAGSIERDGHVYPLGYHHILDRSTTLLYFLELIGALDRVRWRRVRMLFRTGGQTYDLASPGGFARFPLGMGDKLRFARLMLRARSKASWRDWEDRGADELIDAWASEAVRHALFEPLTRLKFDLPCSEVSAAWLGARLYHREGAAPLGYIPGTNWTRVLCEGLARLCLGAGVQVILRAGVTRLGVAGDRLTEAELADGRRLEADLFVSTLPTPAYRALAGDHAAHLEDIGYTALLSTLCVTRQPVHPDFYWMNLWPGHTASGLFRLEALNPTIGGPGETCLNFVTHLGTAAHPTFALSDDALLGRYGDDFRSIFGYALDPSWTRVSRVAMYSPIFVRRYRNPPVRSPSLRNVLFAGNFRTSPSIASISTALDSGLEAAQEVLRERGRRTDLPDAAARFRPRRLPRA